MSFRLSHNISNSKSSIKLTKEQKMANQLENEIITLKNNGDRYIYYPSDTYCPHDMNYKTQNLKDNTQLSNKKLTKLPEIKEELIFDKNKNNWSLVKTQK